MLSNVVLMQIVAGKHVQTYHFHAQIQVKMAHVQVVGRSVELLSHALWDITVYFGDCVAPGGGGGGWDPSCPCGLNNQGGCASCGGPNCSLGTTNCPAGTIRGSTIGIRLRLFLRYDRHEHKNQVTAEQISSFSS